MHVLHTAWTVHILLGLAVPDRKSTPLKAVIVVFSCPLMRPGVHISSRSCPTDACARRTLQVLFHLNLQKC